MSDDEATPAAEVEGSAAPVAEEVGGSAAPVAEEVGGSAAPSAERYRAVLSDSLGDVVLHTGAEHHLEVLTAAHADGFDQLIDLTAVDYLAFAAPRSVPSPVDPQRFEVVTQLINHTTGERIRIRTQVAGAEPVVPTAFDLWPGSEALEREVYDMFGIEFADHPDMSRVLMPDDWVGHPLRKDYAVGSIPVQFKAASNIR